MDSPAKAYSDAATVTHRVLFVFVLACVLFRCPSTDAQTKSRETPRPAAEPMTYTIERGEIDGAQFALAKPSRWNGHLLLQAHGFRPESAPLVADITPERAAYQVLLREGWAIAKTSYRRNGVIVADALHDLDLLRAEAIRRLGKPIRVVVEGESMGGLIALILAERRLEDEPLYHGVVAIGAALNLRDPAAPQLGVNLQPQIPVVLLSNRNEFEPSRLYAEAKLPGSARPHPPYLLRVGRDGHINVNQAERLYALRSLLAWLEHGRAALPAPEGNVSWVDATRVPEPGPSRVFLDSDNRGFVAHVTEVTSVFGNILLDAQAADFAAVGLMRNAYFQIKIGEKSFRVLYGRDFSSAKPGEWVTFENADGFFWLGRNKASAASTASVQPGDVVHVRRYPTDSSSEQSN
jgi:pimeloyl-ACP methyl ester carboxylesterase